MLSSYRRSSRTMRTASLAALALSIPFALSACGSSAVLGGDDTSDELTIGLLAVQSGTLAQTGAEQNDGFQLYLDQHDGKLGGRDITVVTSDEGATPDVAVTAAQRLINRDQVSALVGITTTAAGLVVRQQAEVAEVPVLVTNAAGDGLTAQASDYLWRMSAPQRELCKAGADPMLEQGKDATYLVIFDAVTGRDCSDALKEAFTSEGGDVVGEDYIPVGTTDFQPYLSRIKKSGAKAVYAFLPGMDAVAFVKQFTEFGMKDDVRLVGLGSMTEGALLAGMGEAALGMQTVLHYSSVLETAENAEFVETFRAAYDYLPGQAAVGGYDAAHALDLALGEIEGEVGGEALSEALAGVAFDSPRGAFSFDDNHDPKQSYYLREVQKQGDELVNAILRPIAE